MTVPSATSRTDTRAVEVLRQLLRARKAYIEAVNGNGHPGEPHDDALVHQMDKDAEWRIIDVVGDCAACGGAQYGTEDELNHYYDEARAILDEVAR